MRSTPTTDTASEGAELQFAEQERTNKTNLLRVSEIVNMHDAKTHFSKLVAKVEAGEEIVIARAGRPCARLVPLDPAVPTLGTMKGRWPELDDEFFESLTGDDLDAWDT